LRESYGVAPSKIVTTHRGYPQDVLLPRERTLPQDGPVRILSANMVRPQKGQHILVPFAEECLKRKLPIKIVIAGVNGESYSSHYNEYYQTFLEAIRKRGLMDTFEFTGPKDHQELNELMLKSDVSIGPLHLRDIRQVCARIDGDRNAHYRVR
jgi:glycosyltransferase involved in cell wall biosynthesis